MQVSVDRKAVFELLDLLLPRWRSRIYPYNRHDAIIPQTIIPDDLRKDQFHLACFYFYLCIYMRGGIESLQAFRALIELWRRVPTLFDPKFARMIPHREMQGLLRAAVGWDSHAAATNWIENSHRLVDDWDADPRNLLRGLRSYDEAVRRIRNKLSKREQREAGDRGRGFRGFQYKMVSMLLYFYDWEGWLSPRFSYPSPADFHNFRLGIAAGAVRITSVSGAALRASEELSRPWRDVIMRYIVKRRADPVEVADAIWLYSLVMCGNSPATTTLKETESRKRGSPLFEHHGVGHEWDALRWAKSKNGAFKTTCGVCPFALTCRPVPAQPYYRQGLILIREPLGITNTLGLDAVASKQAGTNGEADVQDVLDLY